MLSALFTSVADALISYAIDKLDPAERIKSWLRLDPARLAFKKALARAYSAFARQYPEYTSSLFDQSFLSTDALPELSKLLTRNQHPDPALLAQAWGRSLGAGADFAQAATKPAAYFLERFEAELKAEPALQSIFDSRALESLPKLEAEIQKLSSDLQRGLDEALKAASDYQKVTLHIGGDIKDSNIIIGDNNVINKYYYSGDFISLNEYYIPPDGVFQRVRVDDFIGRDWLTAKVDAFLNDPNRKSGAFLLIGDAGVGKTSFMAHLVKERRYLHLFAEQVPGQAMLQRAMQSLGSQLVTRYQIDPYKDRDTLNALSVFPDFLERILRLAASTLTEGEKIVIVCDALDEAGTFPDHFVFGLPKELPDGVYFILSQRPVNVKLPNFEPVIEKLDAQGEGNLQDMQAYLSAVAKRPEVAGQIRSKEYSEEFFSQTLKEKSQGVWMYLHYIIKEIESGARAPLDLANLPTGLVGYYAEYWDAWRTGKSGKGEEAWDELYAPLLTTLAVAQEAITVETLIQWVGVTVTPREVTRLLTENWRAFITEKEVYGKKAYTPYHLSFKDFITGRVDTDKLPPAQANLVKDLASQTVDAHKRIVNAFEKECNGEWEKLVVQDYPRLHLTAHLNGAREYEKLRMLLTEGDEKIKWVEAREQKEETYAGYLNDLTYVWDYAEREQNYALAIRCMLIENSIHSLAENIPPQLLTEIARTGLWSYVRCLSIIREKSDPYRKAISLEQVSPFIPEILVGDALSIACEIKEEFWRAEAISALAFRLGSTLIETAFKNVSEIRDDAYRSNGLIGLSPYLTDDLVREISIIARKTTNEADHVRLLIASALRLHPKEKVKTLRNAIQIARKIEDKYIRLKLLMDLAKYTSTDLKATILQDAFSIANELVTNYPAIDAFNLLLPCSEGLLQQQAAHKALISARARNEKFVTVKIMAQIIPYLDDTTRRKILVEAFSIASEIQVEPQKAEALSDLAPLLSGAMQKQAFYMACNINSEIERASVLTAFAPYLSYDLQLELLSVVRNLKYKSDQAEILSALTSQLDGEPRRILLQEAISLTREIRDESSYGRILVSLASHMDKDEEIEQIFHQICDIQDDFVRANNLSHLTPFLSDVLKAVTISVTNENKTYLARERVLSALAPYLDNIQIMNALSVAHSIQDPSHRARALAILASHLNNEYRGQALEDALSAARYINNQTDAYKTFSTLAPLLGEELCFRAFSIIQDIADSSSRASALIPLIPFLDKSLLGPSFYIACDLGEEYHRNQVLTALFPYLTGELREKVLLMAQESRDKNYRIFFLATLSQYLSGEFKEDILQEVLDVLREDSLSDYFYDNLARILIYFPPELITQICSQTLQIEDDKVLVRALWSVASYFDETFKEHALVVAKGIRNKDLRIQALYALTPHLADPIRKKIAKEILRATRITNRSQSLLRMRSNVNQYLREELQNEVFQEELLASESGSVEQLIVEWKDSGYIGLKNCLIEFFRIRSKQDREKGVNALDEFIPALITIFGKGITKDILGAVLDVTRWWP